MPALPTTLVCLMAGRRPPTVIALESVVNAAVERTVATAASVKQSLRMILLLREHRGSTKEPVDILNSRAIPNECCLTHLVAVQPAAMNAPESVAEMNKM